jgi:hypothetical protein
MPCLTLNSAPISNPNFDEQWQTQHILKGIQQTDAGNFVTEAEINDDAIAGLDEICDYLVKSIGQTLPTPGKKSQTAPPKFRRMPPTLETPQRSESVA